MKLGDLILEINTETNTIISVGLYLKPAEVNDTKDWHIALWLDCMKEETFCADNNDRVMYEIIEG